MGTITIGGQTLRIPEVRKTITVNVTEAHRRDGKIRKIKECPLALACMEHFGLGKGQVYAERDYLSIYLSDGTVFHFKYSKPLEHEVKRFDETGIFNTRRYRLTRTK